MEELQARHRKEQRELQAKITQKKKAASKKTRKGVNDECANLERELQERQAQELSTFNGDTLVTGDSTELHDEARTSDQGDGEVLEHDGVSERIQKLSLTSEPVATNINGQDFSQQSSAPKKQNRQKARLARRAAEQEALATQAAEEAANMPNLREQEREKMRGEFKRRQLQEKEIRADGHCLYSAVADQLDAMGVGLKPRIQPTLVADGEEAKKLPGYQRVRQAAAAYIQENSDDFVPFLEEPLDEYVHKVKDTAEWGGQLELLALAKTYGVSINVIQGDGRLEKVDGRGEGDEEKTIWLAYYRHGFGLGEHYNSLRKTP